MGDEACRVMLLDLVCPRRFACVLPREFTHRRFACDARLVSDARLLVTLAWFVIPSGLTMPQVWFVIPQRSEGICIALLPEKCRSLRSRCEMTRRLVASEQGLRCAAS
jgi:hypothetical protein